MGDKQELFINRIQEAKEQGLSSAASVEYALSFLKEDNTVKDSVKVLVDALSNDKDYRRSWVANIAMSFMDVHTNVELQFYDSMMAESLHKRANDAAENFINLLCRDVDSE